jgi:hypothetical protein
MKSKIIYMVLALTVAIGGGILMNQSFADETYSYINVQAPESCICSAPADLATRANRTNRDESSLKSNLEPKYLLSLYNCQCGPLTCAVTAQAISCRK